MPCLSLMLKGSELVGEHSFVLRRTLKCKYLKLLHFYTNLDSSGFNTTGIAAGTKLQERLLFCKLSFLNSDQYDNFDEGHSYISLGATKCGGKNMLTRDLYKVLLDKPTIHLQGDIRIRFYYMDAATKLQPITSSDIIATQSSQNIEVSFANLVLEYEEI